MRTLRVAELFAGIGGFRIGFEAANRRLRGHAFDVIWSNQWEPSTKLQHASAIYVARFGVHGHSNVDIATVDPDDVPDVDLVVGGFPCQDYSVATTLPRAEGISGTKGVLWWQIYRLLRDKRPRPPYLLLENVDRLLKSPVSQRGRDFAIMLASLANLGYIVEWRVINSADYGAPQRRRRVFILAFHTSTLLAREASRSDALDWLHAEGVFAGAFPVGQERNAPPSRLQLDGTLAQISRDFSLGRSRTPFGTAGLLQGCRVVTMSPYPEYSGPRKTLGHVLERETEIPSEYFLSEVAPWEALKGAKAVQRTHRDNGYAYTYAEGAIAFPDSLDKPSRTVVTGEGGGAPSRSTHVVETPSGRLRRLVPAELERLYGFPKNHTLLPGISSGRRAFLLGNAVVTGVIKRAAVELAGRLQAARCAKRSGQT